jgi:hypothetical protein
MFPCLESVAMLNVQFMRIINLILKHENKILMQANAYVLMNYREFGVLTLHHLLFGLNLFQIQ